MNDHMIGPSGLMYREKRRWGKIEICVIGKSQSISELSHGAMLSEIISLNLVGHYVGGCGSEVVSGWSAETGSG